MRCTAFLLPTAIGFVASSIAAGAAAQTNVELGKREFAGKCAVCHGTDAKGDGPYAADLKRRPADLTTIARRNGGLFPMPRMYDIIEGSSPGHGPKEMPVWGWDYTIQASQLHPGLPEDQAAYVRTRIASLLEYLNRLQVK